MKKLTVLKKMHIFQIITNVIILKQLLFNSGSVNVGEKNLDFVSVFIHQYSPRRWRIIVKYCNSDCNC